LQRDVPLPAAPEDALGGEDEQPVAALAAALDRELEILWDRIDARLYRIDLLLDAKRVPEAADPVRRWWQRGTAA
jgi:hypothetical protein